MVYGAPYKGSKSKISDNIINALPSGDRLVDLFGGGFAISHYALLSKKWNKVLYNDIKKPIVRCIDAALSGCYDEKIFKPEFITRDQFLKLKDGDEAYNGYVQMCWSFGNDCRTYVYGRNRESMCHMIHDYLVFDKDDIKGKFIIV